MGKKLKESIQTYIHIVFGAAAMHVFASAASGIYGIILARGRYLGADPALVPRLTEIMVGHYIIRIGLFPLLPVVILCIPIALLGADKNKARKIGLSFYVSLSAVLLISAPAALANIPLLSRAPIWAALAMLLTITLFITHVAYASFGRRVAFLTYLLLITAAPHDLARAVWQRISVPYSKSVSEKRLLIFVIDALRIDAAKSSVGTSAQIRTGYSHYGSTRKQYRLLYAGNSSALQRATFIPSRSEFVEADNSETLSELSHAAGIRFRFIVDNATTANATTLGIPASEVIAPSKGIQDALAQSNELIPLAAWSWNVVSPVEGINPWSDLIPS